jgi:hypothetical protein
LPLQLLGVSLVVGGILLGSTSTPTGRRRAASAGAAPVIGT